MNNTLKSKIEWDVETDYQGNEIISFFNIDAMGLAGAEQAAEQVLQGLLYEGQLSGDWELYDSYRTDTVSERTGWNDFVVKFWKKAGEVSI